MANNKEYRRKNLQVLGVLLIYLFAASAHIFFLTPSSLPTNSTHNSIFKRKIEGVHSNNLVERSAKAIFKENTQKVVAEVPLTCLDFLSASFHIDLSVVKLYDSNSRQSINGRYTYLSFCILRI